MNKGIRENQHTQSQGKTLEPFDQGKNCNRQRIEYHHTKSQGKNWDLGSGNRVPPYKAPGKELGLGIKDTVPPYKQPGKELGLWNQGISQNKESKKEQNHMIR